MRFLRSLLSWFSFRKRKPSHVEPQVPKYSFPTALVGVQKLPFTLAEDEVIFVQDGEPSEADVFVKEHQQRLEDCFNEAGLRFVYLPTLRDKIATSEEIFSYWRPSASMPTEPLPLLPLDSTYLLQYMVRPENRVHLSKAALWTYLYDERGKSGKGPHIFFRVELDEAFAGDEAYFDELIKAVKGKIRQYPLYSIRQFPTADDGFDYESKKLLAKASVIINRLRCLGISEQVLAGLLQPQKEPSQLHITSDNRILLSDFNDLEVQMTPLVKAVFFLFMRHPEGIAFKELPDYADELAGLYDAIRDNKPTNGKFDTPKKLNENIQRLVDPTDNSINEKCARIREAFLLSIHEQMAHHYFVTGERGKPKRIDFPRDKIQWDGK